MEFIEAPAFSRRRADYLDDDQLRRLQSELAKNPQAGDLMPGTGGFRKMRWADPRRGKGRRSGLRIVYYHFPSHHQVWLMTLYDKDEASDLTAQQKKVLKATITEELRARTVRKRTRQASSGRIQ